MEKKSTSGANIPAAAAVAATSTMMPSSGTRVLVSAAACASAARTCLTSYSDLTIGTSTASWVSRPASSIALSWSLRAPGSPSSAARPGTRQERNGGILSPEKSSSRTTAGWAASRLRTGVSCAR